MDLDGQKKRRQSFSTWSRQQSVSQESNTFTLYFFLSWNRPLLANMQLLNTSMVILSASTGAIWCISQRRSSYPGMQAALCSTQTDDPGGSGWWLRRAARIPDGTWSSASLQPGRRLSLSSEWQWKGLQGSHKVRTFQLRKKTKKKTKHSANDNNNKNK